MPKALIRTPFAGLGLAVVALFLLFPTALRAQEDDTSGASGATLSDSTGDGLGKLKPFLDAKDWSGAVKQIDTILEGVTADSYDQAFLLETKAKLLTQSNQYTMAIVPLATALAIGDRHHFYTKRAEMDLLYFLSQLYYQEAESTKAGRDAQIEAYEKSIDAIQRWFKLSPKPSADMTEYYSRLLYAEAVAKDGQHPDPELIKQAQEQVEKTLRMSAHPKDASYVFMLATLQQQQNYSRAAAILELLLAKNPSNKTYWQDLVTFYIVLAQNAKDPDLIRKYNIRAINALERAQALGFMKTPKDNYLLFTFYYETGQYGTAAQLLYDGLTGGTIDSDLDKWELLSSSYQQINQELSAVDALKEASIRYPKNGDLDLKIGGIYAGMDKGDEAFKYYKLAEEKGGLVKSQHSYLLLALAYQAYELQKFDDAKDAIDKAMALQSGKTDRQLKILKGAIEEAIKNRDAKKAGAAQ